MSGSSGSRRRRTPPAGYALRLDDQVCAHCERELESEWVEFPPALQRKYEKPGEWYYHPCTPECEQKNERREWELMRRNARVVSLLQKSGLSKRLRSYGFHNFDADVSVRTRKAAGKVLDYLKDWEENQETGKSLYLCGGVGTGKCVAASEHLNLADGRRVRAADLVGREFELLTLVGGKPTAVKARAKWNVVEPVWEIQTETGKRAVRNAEHPFYVGDPVSSRNKDVKPRGWRDLASIAPGQVVAATDVLPAFDPGEGGRLPEDEVKLLAYLIGDGGLTQPTARFSQAPGAQLEEMRAIVERFGARLVYHGGVDYRIVGTETRTSRSSSRSGFTTHRFNRVCELLKRHGLAGKHSREKRVPRAVFGLPRDQLVTFLSRLYATDGWAYCRRPRLGRLGTVEIGFCSASEALVRDVQELLLKLGISARVRKRPGVDAWYVVIDDARQVLAFADEVGIFGKEEAVEAACEVAKGIRERGKDRQKWRRRISPEGTHWETVTAIRRLGVEPTVAIEVPGYHTFLTVFWEHNTHLAVALMNELIRTQGVPCLFVTVPELLDNLRGAYNDPGRNLDEWMDTVKNADLLVLDDLGSERATEWVQERIFVIVNHRYREALPTVFTSNIGPKGLAEQLGERTASRIIAMCKEGIELEGRDYRETVLRGRN